MLGCAIFFLRGAIKNRHVRWIDIGISAGSLIGEFFNEHRSSETGENPLLRIILQGRTFPLDIQRLTFILCLTVRE